MKITLYLNALRAARPRQLRARALRGANRRRFPSPPGSSAFRPVGVGLWRTPAFAHSDDIARDDAVDLFGKEFAYPFADWTLPGEPRIRRFHAHYGDEILGWVRRGELASSARGIASWIDANPPRVGDPWHPYPLSTRVCNWIAALSIAPELADSEAVGSLRRQLAFLERNVENDVLGNHVIRNACALVLGGIAFDDSRLRTLGLELVRRELPEQILSDGGHYERSPVYHLVVLRDLLQIYEASGEDWLDEPIARMQRFAAALTRPDGEPALFNDGALDLAPRLDLPAAPLGLAVFPETGYAVFRDERIWLAFDCGPPAPPFLPAHAHADALSFQLWVDGRPAVVDPGTYTYEAGADRDWFRSTSAHSTVTVDERNQFELWGAFRAGPLPRVTLLGSSPLEAQVEYAGIRHRRSITVHSSAVEVADTVDGSKHSAVSSSLPLANGALVEIDSGGHAELREDEDWLSERMLCRSPIRTVRGSSESKLPWEGGWSVRLPSAL